MPLLFASPIHFLPTPSFRARVGGRELRRLTYRFVEAHRGHAVDEERALFPFAATRLSPMVLLEMGRETRQRNATRPRSPA